MSIFSIKPQQQDAFINAPEIYQGVQLGYFQDDQDQGYCIVVNAMIGIDLRGDLRAELDYFVGQTWRPTGPLRGFNYEQRYQIYWENLKFYDSVLPVLTDRASLPSTLTLTTPPPPPGRPSLIPGAPLGRGTLPPTVGHLPFSTNVLVDEVFYRWESWPTSRRIDPVANTVAPWTFVSPSSEVPFAPTGFSAVSRMALPSFFPAMFRHRINPVAGSTMLCGAVVPMFGQSGGGVEVCFDSVTTNDGSIAKPVVLPPL
jgi:hypothetical protein